ncbi:hypothetical protein [Lacisediminimonas profundi]|uniref:hypothetical protein n=1 Tax=Lacisediminimonas profundi TaxID=2603856 RepID=UPI00124B713D|nr:hypothetical protein [Lacisediminimonas profundi]
MSKLTSTGFNTDMSEGPVMRILACLPAIAICLCQSLPLAAWAHGVAPARTLPSGPHHGQGGPAQQRYAPPPHMFAPPPGMYSPPPPLYQTPPSFAMPANPPWAMQPGTPGWQISPMRPPMIIESEPSLRERRLFEEELRLRQWHERELRRQHDDQHRDAGQDRRWQR